MSASQLAALLGPARLTEVVDIGANPIDGDPPYKPLLDAGACRVTGFEPLEAALASLRERQGPNQRYLPYAIGDGRTGTLRVCAAPGMTSLLEPDPVALGMFQKFSTFGQVTDRVPLETRRMDDVAEVRELDLLKIDCQGSELAVFRNGRKKLSRAVAVQTEVSFVPLYQGQPAIGELDLELREQGFMPHCAAAVKLWPLVPLMVEGDVLRPLNQLLEADFVYVRDLRHPERMDDEQLKHLALVAHGCYRSYDLAARCILHLEERGALARGSQERYFEMISAA